MQPNDPRMDVLGTTLVVVMLMVAYILGSQCGYHLVEAFK